MKFNQLFKTETGEDFKRKRKVEQKTLPSKMNIHALEETSVREQSEFEFVLKRKQLFGPTICILYLNYMQSITKALNHSSKLISSSG